MILYHVTQDLSHSGFFKPKFPSCVLAFENQEIDRVCTSKTLSGCFSSMPSGGENLEESTMENGSVFKVFEIDTEKLGISKIVTDEELTEKRYVFDAFLSEEHWILDEFQVPKEDITYINLEGYEEKDISYENYLFFEHMENRKMTKEEFINSEYFNPERHLDTYTKIYDLFTWVLDDEEIAELKAS